MRLRAALLILSLAGLPASGAEPIAEQAAAAYEIFAGGLSQQTFMSAGYGDEVFRDIAGNWVRLNGPQDKSGIETYGTDTAKFCASPAALTLASTDPISLQLTTNLPDKNFSQAYVLIAGATFAEHTDPGPYFDAIGLGPDKTGSAADEQRAVLLSLANGLVQIYRPSDDILVITRDRAYPIILARCPTDSAAPPATEPSSVPPADASSSVPMSSSSQPPPQ